MSMGKAVTFKARLLRPAQPRAAGWVFLCLPKAASDTLPRRGRVAVTGRLNGTDFAATLEPDGQLSHWLKVDAALCMQAQLKVGAQVRVSLQPAKPVPEPALPDDLQQAIGECPAALAVWQATTTLARVDWIHWVESAKQGKTRAQRIANACQMLASGKRRVCCFDVSGHYDNSLSAPQAAE